MFSEQDRNMAESKRTKNILKSLLLQMQIPKNCAGTEKMRHICQRFLSKECEMPLTVARLGDGCLGDGCLGDDHQEDGHRETGHQGSSVL